MYSSRRVCPLARRSARSPSQSSMEVGLVTLHAVPGVAERHLAHHAAVPAHEVLHLRIRRRAHVEPFAAEVLVEGVVELELVVEQRTEVGVVELHRDVVGQGVRHERGAFVAAEDDEVEVDVVLERRVAECRRPQHVHQHHRHGLVMSRRDLTGARDERAGVETTDAFPEIAQAGLEAEALHSHGGMSPVVRRSMIRTCVPEPAVPDPEFSVPGRLASRLRDRSPGALVMLDRRPHLPRAAARYCRTTQPGGADWGCHCAPHASTPRPSSTTCNFSGTPHRRN